MGRSKRIFSKQRVPQPSKTPQASAQPSKTPQASAHPSELNLKGPSIGDSIKTGVGFGVGSAVAHKAIDGLMGSSNSYESTSTPLNSSEYQPQNEQCGSIFLKYIECVDKNDKFHPLCTQIEDFMKKYNCSI